MSFIQILSNVANRVLPETIYFIPDNSSLHDFVINFSAQLADITDSKFDDWLNSDTHRNRELPILIRNLELLNLKAFKNLYLYPRFDDVLKIWKSLSVKSSLSDTEQKSLRDSILKLNALLLNNSYLVTLYLLIARLYNKRYLEFSQNFLRKNESLFKDLEELFEFTRVCMDSGIVNDEINEINAILHMVDFENRILKKDGSIEDFTRALGSRLSQYLHKRARNDWKGDMTTDLFPSVH